VSSVDGEPEGVGAGEPYVRYRDWKAWVRPDLARAIFPLELADEAFAPLQGALAAEDEEFRHELWTELAIACVSYVRVQLEQPFCVTIGSPPRAPTVPQLLSQIMDGAKQIVLAADEILRQALQRQITGAEPDEGRLTILRYLSHALTLSHLPQEQRDAVRASVKPGFRDNPFGPKTSDSGLSPLVALYEEAHVIYEKWGGTTAKEKLRPLTGRHRDPDRQALILDLSEIYRQATGQRATAHAGSEKSEGQQESLFMKFVGQTFGILQRTPLVVARLDTLRVPSPRTVHRYLNARSRGGRPA
jgi:hypothetical protein